MSVNSEIQDLQTNLTAAKAAVTTAGGTVGDTGLAGLATEIASIPSGGGGMPDDPTTSYGAVMYYSRWANEYSATNINSCTINSIDQAKLATWAANNNVTSPIDFNYNWGMWEVMTEFEPIEISQSSFQSQTGISVTLDPMDPSDPGMGTVDYASFRAVLGPNVDKTSPIVAGTLTSAEYDALGASNYDATSSKRSATLANRSCTIEGVSVPVAAFKRFVFGTVPTYTPTGFLAGSEVESISAIPNNTTYPTKFTIGDGFMAWCENFNAPLKLDSNNSIVVGDYFMAGCTSFNSPLDDRLQIQFTSGKGQNFMNRCYNFNCPLPLDCFAGLTTVPAYFMQYCMNYSGPLNFPEATTVNDNFFTSSTYGMDPSGTWTWGEGVSLNMPKVTTIGMYFFYNKSGFNTPWQLPALTTPNSQLFGMEYNNASNFQYDITLPQGLTRLRTGSFSYLMHSITIDVGSLDPSTILPSSTADKSRIFCAGDLSQPAYTTGIKIKGANRAAWLTALPNNPNSPYRKLIDGGA